MNKYEKSNKRKNHDSDDYYCCGSYCSGCIKTVRCILMEKNLISNLLLITLLIGNSMFILITVKSKEPWQLLYNIVIVGLNIVYYLLQFIPEEKI